MKPGNFPRRKRPRPKSRAKDRAQEGAREFLLRTFYYLKGEKLLSASRRLFCEAS